MNLSVTFILVNDKKSGEAYIITGPIYSGENIQRIGSRVLVPTKLFKAIYLPSSGQGGAYLTVNAAGDNYSVISIAQLEKLTGINIFPKMTSAAKQQTLFLPPVKGDTQVPFENIAISQHHSTLNIYEEILRFLPYAGIYVGYFSTKRAKVPWFLEIA